MKEKNRKKTKKAVEVTDKKVRKKIVEESPVKTDAEVVATGRPDPVFWKAPKDFTAHYLVVQVRTDKDGMFTNRIEATRYAGAYSEDAPESKKFDLGSYDIRTLMGIQARLASVTFHPTGRPNKAGVSPRLIPNTTYKILYRVGVRRADNTLSVGLRTVSRLVTRVNTKTGKRRIREILLERSDPDFRKLLKSAKFLPAAFANVKQPVEVESTENED